MNHDGSSEHGQQQRRGVFDVDEDRALDGLTLAWGDEYDAIWVHDGEWRRAADAGDGEVFTGATPDALNRAIPADSARRGIRLPGPEHRRLREVFFHKYGARLTAISARPTGSSANSRNSYPGWQVLVHSPAWTVA